MRWFGRPYMTMAPRFVISTYSTLFTILFSLSIKPQDSFTSLSLFSSGQLRLLSLSLSLNLFFSQCTPLQTQSQYKNLPLTSTYYSLTSPSVTVLNGSPFNWFSIIAT
jgi:hypothetical protein